MHLDVPSGIRIAFDDQGKGRPMVLLHGLSDNRRTYDEVVAHVLARGGVRAVSVDLRGHGESGRAHGPDGYDAPSYAADVVSLLEHLFDEPALLVGHSLGGVTAASVAATRPDLVCALLCEDPPFFEGDDIRRAASPVASFFPRLVKAVTALQDRDAPLEDFDEVAASHVPPSMVAARARSLWMWDPATMQAAIDGVVWRGFDPTASLAVPLTILRADPACGAVFEPRDVDPVLATNPTARIEMVPGAVHQIHSGPTLAPYLAALDRCCEETSN